MMTGSYPIPVNRHSSSQRSVNATGGQTASGECVGVRNPLEESVRAGPEVDVKFVTELPLSE